MTLPPSMTNRIIALTLIMGDKGTVGLEGISLMPRDMMQNLSSEVLVTEHLQIHDPASTYKLFNSTTFLRVHGILSGIIAKDNLHDFHGSGLLPPLALIILRCYLSIEGYHDGEVEKTRNLIQNRCLAESMKLPLNPKGWVWYYVNRIAQYAMNFVKLRLDGESQSVCFG